MSSQAVRGAFASLSRYKDFKAALEGLDPQRQSVSPLPIIYQWQEPIAGTGTKYAHCQGARSCAGCYNHVRDLEV